MTVFEAELGAFADDWALQDKAQSTVEAYCAQLRKYHQWCLAEELQTTTIRSAKRYLVERSKHSQWTAFYVSRAIKAFGKWWAREYQATDPFEQLSYVTQPKPKQQRTTTAADVDAMLAVCGDDFRGIRDRALIHTFASTGMRRSEVARMMWDDINMGSGTIVVPKSKNGQPRTVRLNKDAQRAMRRYWHALDHWEMGCRRDPSPYVWPSTTRRAALTANGVGQMLIDRALEAGADVTAHAFRRGFAVTWLRGGGSESYLREVAGWESPRMVAQYVSAVAQEEALIEHERIFG
jgi:integrase/recombinase XerD